MAEKSSDQGGAEVRPVGDGVTDDRAAIQRQIGGDPKSSPHDHAKALGTYKERAPRGGSVVVSSVNGQSVASGSYSLQHAAAAALHGWAEHEHHEAKAIQISADDYKAALLAASAPVVRAGEATDRVVPNGKDGGVRLVCKKDEKLDLQKLDLSTYDLANAGVQFAADYEPHKAALSKHAAYAKIKAKG